MSPKGKEKMRILRFHITWNFQYRRKTCGAKRSLSFTASPGVERVRTPSAYFFDTFFRTSEKSAAAMCRSNFRGRAIKKGKYIFRKSVSVFVP